MDIKGRTLKPGAKVNSVNTTLNEKVQPKDEYLRLASKMFVGSQFLVYTPRGLTQL